MRIRIGIFLAAAAISLSPGAAWSQTGWNVDLTFPGNPAPSSTFGGALGDEGKGYWNAIPAEGMVATVLKDFAGNDSSVVMSGPSGGFSGENNFQGNTGDFALLLNDGRQVLDSDTYSFTGLAEGQYMVYLYAAAPDNDRNPTRVVIAGAEGMVTGPMPGNRFQ